ncbi:MAG: hypothetical protein J1G07_01845 [Clostridiales bacterium]|nr:hypothetical protein [Clostridiales bacterium]
MENNYFEILFSDNQQEDFNFNSQSFSANESKIDKLIAKSKSKIFKISDDILKKNILEVIDKIGEIFTLDENNPYCFIDEIEFGLSINVDGKVSILSVIEGGVSTGSTFILKLRRRKDNV